MLLLMFVLVARVHHAAGVAVAPPAIFATLALLKLLTAPLGKPSAKLD